MKFSEFKTGDVIYRTKPTIEKFGEDRSFMDSILVFLECQGNLVLLKDVEDHYDFDFTLEIDKYDDGNWNFYPVFTLGRTPKNCVLENGHWFYEVNPSQTGTKELGLIPVDRIPN